MSEFNIALAAVGGMVLGLLSRPLKSTFVSLPLLALLFGVLLGPQGLDLLHPERWGLPQRCWNRRRD